MQAVHEIPFRLVVQYLSCKRQIGNAVPDISIAKPTRHLQVGLIAIEGVYGIRKLID
jgi:hypothetical protein